MAESKVKNVARVKLHTDSKLIIIILIITTFDPTGLEMTHQIGSCSSEDEFVKVQAPH